jgi:indole-3-glycerol phosphate synthase
MILERIVETKRAELASLKAAEPLSYLEECVRGLPTPRDFKKAICGAPCSIIAEVKKRSPSKGRMREGFDPVKIAMIYQKNGASAISVLTDTAFFEGHRTHLSGIRSVVELPLLRKDFVIDPYQIFEARVLGADAILLIARLLEQPRLEEYIGLAEALGLFPLVEVHTRTELEMAMGAGAEIIGINNRDLNTFSTDLKTTLDLVPVVRGDHIVVRESGIKTREDIETLMAAGIHAFLVGETLMRADDMGAKLKELLGRKE